MYMRVQFLELIAKLNRKVHICMYVSMQRPLHFAHYITCRRTESVNTARLSAD